MISKDCQKLTPHLCTCSVLIQNTFRKVLFELSVSFTILNQHLYFPHTCFILSFKLDINIPHFYNGFYGIFIEYLLNSYHNAGINS